MNSLDLQHVRRKDEVIRENEDKNKKKKTHIYREHNKVFDTHATWLMDNCDSSPGAQWEVADLPRKIQEARPILMPFDGARRGSGLGAAAWVL